MIQASPDYRLDESSLDNTFVRMANGEMAPLSQFVNLTKVYGAESLSRFNMYNSIGVNAMPAPGYSSGDAINAVKEVAATSLPKGYGYDFAGITREENQESNTTAVIFAICILMIYLILSALYESFLIPFAVILSVPFGLMGSFLFARMMGLENNIYLQTGLIMLIGLLAKTAILLTEYATERRAAGMSLTSAALSAAKVRLRPILMTALTMIFGLLPLVVATGVGANGNSSLGNRCCRRYADRNARPAVRRSFAVHCIPVFAGESAPDTVRTDTRLADSGRSRRSNCRAERISR